VSVRLGRLEDSGVRLVGEFTGPTCLVLARTDYDVCRVEVPARLPQAELEAAVRFRLREVYPGQEEGSVLDLLSFRIRDTLRVLASVVRREVMDHYRAASEGAPVVPAYRLLRRARAPRPTLLVGPDWAELMVADPEGVLDSRLLRPGAEGLGALVREEMEAAGSGARGLVLLGDQRDLTTVRNAVAEGMQPLSNGHAPAILRRSIRPAPFSPGRTRSGRTRKILDIALAAAVLGSLVYATTSGVRSRVRELDRIQVQLVALSAAAVEYQSLSRELESLRGAPDVPSPATAVALLSELALALPRDTAVSYVSYDAPGFRVEGSSAEPLLIPGLLSARPGFEAITVGSVVKQQDGAGFRFVLQGRYR
jgi:hypothetical protein